MPGVAFAFTIGSLGDILATAGLAAQVAKTLYDGVTIKAECKALVLELKSLQKTLILTHHALQHYQLSPIGEALAGFIEPEVAQTNLLLQGYLDKINACRQALLSTSITSLWRRVSWMASSESLRLNESLRHHEGKLTMLLVALNSVGLFDLGSEIRQVGAHVQEVHKYLRENARPLRRIQDNTIRVLDPLGEIIPIPELFISSWESFDHVIKGYFKNRIGQRYIEQGRYEVLRSENSRLINPFNLTNSVKAGDNLEMSIVLRQKMDAGAGDVRQCPRCSHINGYNSGERWTRCTRCSGQFRRISRSRRASLGDPPTVFEVKNLLREKNSSSDFIVITDAAGHIEELAPQSEVHFFRRISSYYLEPVACMPDNGKALTSSIYGVQPAPSSEQPQWLERTSGALPMAFPRAHRFEVVPIKSNGMSEPEWRIKCHDCPGKLYFTGPGGSLDNFKVHLRNGEHLQRVRKRLKHKLVVASTAGKNE